MIHPSLPPRPRRILSSSIAVLTAGLAVVPMASAQVTLTGTSYIETFDSLAAGLPTGWTVRTGATANDLGTPTSLLNQGAPADWSNTTGGFKNFAAADNAGFTGMESSATQSAAADRALGIRQTGTVGDPGAAFTLQLANTTGLGNFSLSFKAQMLNVQTRSTTWTLQYGLGDIPGSFTTLATYSDPGVFGSTLVNAAGALSGIADQNQTVWLRIVALSPSTGSGSRDTFGIDDFELTYSSAAAPLYWDLNGSAAGVGGVTGTWDGTSQNWNPSASGTGAPSMFKSASTAIFGGTAGSVQIAQAGVTAGNGLQFITSGYVVQGGTLTLDGAAPSVAVANAGDLATISAPIAGAGFTKTGDGRLVLTSNANSYTGATTIAAGALEISNDAQLGAASADVALLGGTLRAATNVTLNAERALSGTGTLDAAGTMEIVGPISAGALTFASSGTIRFSNPTQSVGGLTFTAGTAGAGAQLDTGAHTLSLNGNLTATHPAGTVRVNGALNTGAANRLFTTADSDAEVDLEINAALSGSGRVQLAGGRTATIQLNGDNSGLTTGLRMNAADAPTVRLGHASALGSGQLFWNGGTLRPVVPLSVATPISLGGIVGVEGAPLTLTGDITFFTGFGSTTPKTFTLGTDLTIQGRLGTANSSASGGIAFVGTGTATLANAANESADPIIIGGPTVVLNGTLSATTAAITVNSGALHGTGAAAGVVNVGDGVFGIGNAGQDVDDASISPGIPGAIGTLTVGGLTLADDAVFTLEINSTGPTPAADKLISLGPVNLGDGIATLNLTSLGTAVLALGTTFLVIDSQSTAPTTGFFAGRGENTRFTVGANQFEFDYGVGTDANDVVLRVVPEPGTAALLAGGAAMMGLRRRRARVQA